jgi:predicted metal-dependent peptidase
MAEVLKSNFEEALCLLSINSPACFNLIIRIITTETDKVETMGVKVWDGQIELQYNRKFIDNLEKAERNYVLIHEMLHILMHHCTWRQSSDLRMKYIDNVAMDLEINSMIHEDNFIKMPIFKNNEGARKKGEQCGLLPKMFGYSDGLSYEQYRALLTKDFPQSEIMFIVEEDGESSNSDGNGGQSNSSGSNGEGDGDSDGSNQNDSGSSMEGKMVIDPNCPLGKITSGRIANDHGKDYNEDTYADDFVRGEVERIQRNNLWGNTPSGTIEKILKAQEQPLDWAGLLRLEAGHFISFEKVYTRRRWDKHFGKPFLGYTMKSVEPVAVYTDTSASVGSSDLSRFIVEIGRIAHFTQVMLYNFDTEIKNPEEPVLFSREAIESIEFKGRGGTSFTPIFEHVKEHEIHQVVILTDGFAEAISQDEVGDASVIWVITKGGSLTGKPGVVVEMQ